MKKKTFNNLITTGLKELNPQKNDLYLGEWCIADNHFKQKNKLKICNYHLNQKKKIKRDHYYLTKLYNKILPSVVTSLNKYHKLNKSKKYWEIIVGPTLVQLLSIFWDRWETIQLVFKKYKINQIPFLDYSQNDFITQDFYDLFVEKMNTHFWNNCIYSEILRDNSKIRIFKIENKKNKKKRFLNHWSKNQILKKFKSKKSSVSKFIFFDENFNKLNLIEFGVSQREFFIKDPIFMKKLDLSKEIGVRNIEINFQTKNTFEKTIVKKIVNFFPISHLEGMSRIKTFVKKIDIKSKYIVTSYGHINNDLFKVWLAEKIETKKSKLIIAHHGGTVEKEINFNSWENISDKLIGWEKNIKKKDYVQLSPIFLCKEKFALKNFTKLFFKKKILFLTTSSSLYTYRIEDKILSSQIKLHLNFWKIFFNKLPLHIKNEFLVRNNPQFDPWNLKRDLNLFFKRNVCSNFKNINTDIYRSKILINTSMSTSFFQSMHSGIPCILLLKDDLWNLSLDGKKIYYLLKKNKIIFTKPKLLVNHLIRINQDPLIWWNNNKTLKARSSFKKQFMKSGSFKHWCEYFSTLN